MGVPEQIKNEIVHTFQNHRNEENRDGMEAYMKNQFLFYGIKTPERKKLLTPILKEYQLLSQTDRIRTALLLFEEAARECQYAALALLEKGKKRASRSEIGIYKELLVTKSWWDTVDMIGSNLCGEYFKKYPDMLKPITEKWRHSRNLWVRRSSILHQLKYKGQTNEKLLFETIDVLKDEKEFFIEKAIGWALREYSKTNSEAVVNYLDYTECRPLSRREGLKWLKNKGMVHQ
ncbi:DNA alkylation repair protein [Halobacillus mangrovi]|uniref:DNA alkylation repair protein n=1 Tax=Halobacillus mangrovi TaxID=402384 RepID=UPI003D95EC69